MQGADIIDNQDLSKLEKLLEKERSVFADPDTLKQASVPMIDNITTGKPIHQRSYRTPFAKRAAVDAEVDKMLKNVLFGPVIAPWPPQAKKNGKLHF